MRVRLEDYPFLLGLQRIDGALVCAAVLISSRYSMTAGKCVAKPGDLFLPAPSGFRLIGGISRTDRHGVSENFEVRVPEMFYVHPNFSQGLFTYGIYHNDIIVIEVKKPFQTSLLKPVSRYLPAGNPNSMMFAVELQKAMRYLCMVVGWQKDSVFSKYESMKLVGHVVTLIKNTDCLDSFCKSGSELCNENLKSEESLICGLAGSKAASCNIDSAGVLICEGSFTGFLSWKPKCGFSRTKVPNIFNAFWPSVDFFKNFTTNMATVPTPRFKSGLLAATPNVEMKPDASSHQRP
ncbi:snake venom serine protease HS112-like [Cimex lectularius]|uniref:Peptidase S1 domain-containing protein n=1 Tax=Cimex lectularius TaxID=79782 RepID=A0A8I6SKN9_CIMLE|nr:snake venom serine protease HS112-like [Cimex lectularius]